MVDPEWADPQRSEAARVELYALLERVGAKGVYYDGACSMRLPVWSVGMAGGGDYKGYAYRPSAHWLGAVTGDALDQIDRGASQIIFTSRRLEGDWFLYFHHWP